MNRTLFWTIIRWLEFVTLVGALLAVIVDPDMSLGGISPGGATVIALLSKGVRLAASELGLPSSSRNALSWIVALLIAAGVFLKQGMPHVTVLLTPIATNNDVLMLEDAPDAFDATHDYPTEN